jgi:hypothetical protein
MMTNRPSVEYDETTFAASLPCRAWEPERESIGGSRTYTAGTATSYVRAKRSFLPLRIRFTEAEYPDVVEMIDWFHENNMGPANVRTDQDDEYTEIAAYLESPAIGEKWRPTRDEGDPSVFALTLIFRSTTDTPISAEYFG